MKQLLRLTALVVGLWCTGRSIYVAVRLWKDFQPFGGIPWSWDFIRMNASVIGELLGLLFLGAALIALSIRSKRSNTKKIESVNDPCVDLVSEFKAELRSGSKFRLNEISQGKIALRSRRSDILFLFERYDPSEYVLFILPPGNPKMELTRKPKAELHIYLLRQLLGAKDVLIDANRTKALAAVFNKYFQEIIDGDFSISKVYFEVERKFFSYLMEINSLDHDDPIKIKLRDYNITWMDDWEKRRPPTQP